MAIQMPLLSLCFEHTSLSKGYYVVEEDKGTVHPLKIEIPSKIKVKFNKKTKTLEVLHSRPYKNDSLSFVAAITGVLLMSAAPAYRHSHPYAAAGLLALGITTTGISHHLSTFPEVVIIGVSTAGITGMTLGLITGDASSRK